MGGSGRGKAPVILSRRSPGGGCGGWRGGGRSKDPFIDDPWFTTARRDADMKEHQYYTYMMSNRGNNVLYVGVTNSLHVRVWQHKRGAIDGFARRYNCDRLVYYEIFDRVEQAIAREKQIKGWTRKKKDSLIGIVNFERRDLAEEWYQEVRVGASAGGPSPSSAPTPTTPTPGAPATQDDSAAQLVVTLCGKSPLP
jgi:putative endonuclease